MTTQRGHTYTEAWRLECEARYVLAMDNDDRIAFLERIAKRRGQAAMETLRNEMVRQYREQDGWNHEQESQNREQREGI